MTTCILTVIKNEHLYLDYWIQYHLNLGIGHIFIIEDIGSDSHQDIVGKYIQATILSKQTIFSQERFEELGGLKYKGTSIQNDLFKGGLNYIKERYSYDWCFTIDVDEFITFQKGYDINVVNEFNEYDAFLLQWQNYGANNRVHTPDYSKKPITEVYTKKCDDVPYDWNHYFIRVKPCRKLSTYSEEEYGTNHVPNGNYVKTDFTKNDKSDSFEKVYIRHYITRSWDEYLNKLLIRGMFHMDHRKLEDFFIYNPSMRQKKKKLIKYYNNLFENLPCEVAIIYYVKDCGNIAKELMYSVRNQQFSSFVCVVVDDGSSDNTKEEIINGAFGDPRIRYVHYDNIGVEESVRNAIMSVQSKYVICVYSPNSISLHYLNNAVKYMDEVSTCSLYYTKSVKMEGYKPIKIEDSLPCETFMFRRRDFLNVIGLNVKTKEYPMRLSKLGNMYQDTAYHFIKRI